VQEDVERWRFKGREEEGRAGVLGLAVASERDREVERVCVSLCERAPPSWQTLWRGPLLGTGACCLLGMH
jgi:hypothetical protein